MHFQSTKALWYLSWRVATNIKTPVGKSGDKDFGLYVLLIFIVISTGTRSPNDGVLASMGRDDV